MKILENEKFVEFSEEEVSVIKQMFDLFTKIQEENEEELDPCKDRCDQSSISLVFNDAMCALMDFMDRDPITEAYCIEKGY